MTPRLVGARFFFDEVPLRAADAREAVADGARFFFDEPPLYGFFFNELPLDAADARAAVADAEKGSSMEEENIKYS